MKKPDLVRNELVDYTKQLRACNKALKFEKRFKRKLETVIDILVWVLNDNNEQKDA